MPCSIDILAPPTQLCLKAATLIEQGVVGETDGGRTLEAQVLLLTVEGDQEPL